MQSEIPETGPEAILHALQGIDMAEVEKKAVADLKTGKKTKRGNAVALLNIARGMERNQLRPEDLMIRSVPVIPAKYRPFAAQGGTFIPGDANVLYKDLFDIRDAYEEEKGMFGEGNAGQSRLALYDAVSSVYGYGEPVKAKTKAKEIKGFLKKLTGSTSKFSYLNRKLLSRTQDNTGRSTITVNPDYGIDDIGLPRDMAMTMYAPYVQRKLKMTGFSDVQALKAVKDRTEPAMHALEQVVKERPVIASRAPAWHAHSFVGAWPKLVDGDAIQTNPFVAAGWGADYDGNCIIGSSQLLVRVALKSEMYPLVSAGWCTDYDDYDKNSIKISVDNGSKKRENNAAMLLNTVVIAKDQNHVVLNVPIKEIPYIRESGARDKNGAMVYDVPEGMEVLTSATDGKGTRWSPIKTLTIEEGCSLRKVTTKGKRTVVVSDNESMAVFDKEKGLIKVKPDEIGTRVVPIVHRQPTEGLDDFDLGWFLGVFLSDGWISDNIIGYTKKSPALRTRFVNSLSKIIDNEEVAKYARTYEELHEAETNCGIGGASVKVHIPLTQLTTSLVLILKDCYDPSVKDRAGSYEERACLFKRIPESMLYAGEETLLGMLCGFLDGDGSVSINRSKNKPQVLVNFSTSSPFLKDGLQVMLRNLGIHSNVSVTSPKKGRVQTHDNYTVTISTPDLVPYLDRMKLTTDYSEAMELLRQVGANTTNIVPLPREVILAAKNCPAEEFTSRGVSIGNLPTLASKAKRGTGGYTTCSRSYARAVAAALQNHPEHIKGIEDIANLFFRVVADDTTWWEYVASVEKAPTETVYDIAVPETKVFALANGLIVFDTINVHVPSSDKAVKETIEKMMPSKTPFSNREEGKLVPLPKQEQVLGLYTAATAPPTKPVRFKTEQEAIEAIRRGEITLSTDVEIG